jgi:glycosyltransferase involved in cell wall biosynthesis
MRLALVSTCASAVSSSSTSDTHLVIHELAAQLQRRGHDVTLFATGDSTNAGNLRSHFASPHASPYAELRHASFAFQEMAVESEPFDVIHSFSPQFLAFSALTSTPIVHTITHARDEQLISFYREFENVTFAATSKHQASRVAELNVRNVVLPGVDTKEIGEGDGSANFCAFASEISFENGAHIAIDAARIAGASLVIAGEAGDRNHAYFELEIRPRLEDAQIDITTLGALPRSKRIRFLQDAAVLVVPTQSEDVFSAVMIEAMLVGTPVVTFAQTNGGHEIVDDGVTGFVVQSRSEMATRIYGITRNGFDRRRCRARALQRWSSARVAEEYERLFDRVLRPKSMQRLRSPTNESPVAPILMPMEESKSIAIKAPQGTGPLFNPLFTRSA